MKKILLLSTVAVVAFAAANLQARHDVEVDINVNGGVREDVTIETNEVRHSDGRPCMFEEGPTYTVPEQIIPAKSFKCPDIPKCPKCTCKAVAVEECSTCAKAAPRHHRTCKSGRCGRRHHRTEVVDVNVNE